MSEHDCARGAKPAEEDTCSQQGVKSEKQKEMLIYNNGFMLKCMIIVPCRNVMRIPRAEI